MQLKLSNVKAFPAIAISIILAVALLLFGVYIVIPPEWLGLGASIAYPNIVAKSIFGVVMSAPSVPILYCNIRYDLKTLVTDKMHKLRPYIFWMGVTWFYICILRILIVGLFPPIFLVYLALAAISFVVWLSNRYI